MLSSTVNYTNVGKVNIFELSLFGIIEKKESRINADTNRPRFRPLAWGKKSGKKARDSDVDFGYKGLKANKGTVYVVLSQPEYKSASAG
jgi:hypothetical protein